MAFRVFGVHLSAVFAAWTERRPRRGCAIRLRALLNAIRRDQHGFHALVGDFNTVTPGELLDFKALPQKVRATVWLSGGRDPLAHDSDRARRRLRRRVPRAAPERPGTDAADDHAAGAPRLPVRPEPHLSRVASCGVVRSDPGAASVDHFPLCPSSG